MHTYDVASDEHRTASLALVIPSLLAGYLVYAATHDIGWSWWWLIGIPSPLAILGGLHLWLDRWGWKMDAVRRVLSIQTPLLAGIWEGAIQSSHEGTNVAFTLDVRQTWTRILLLGETPSSRSQSKTASLLTPSSGGPVVVYTYLNRPTSTDVDSMHMHHGTATLYLEEAGTALSGDYYTGRDRMTHGAILVHRRPS